MSEEVAKSPTKLLFFRRNGIHWVHGGQANDIYNLYPKRSKMSQFITRKGMERRTAEQGEAERLVRHGIVRRSSPHAVMITATDLVEYLDNNEIPVEPYLRAVVEKDRKGKEVTQAQLFFTSKPIVLAVVRNFSHRFNLKPSDQSELHRLILNELKARPRNAVIDEIVYPRLGEESPEWCEAWQILWLCGNTKFMESLKTKLLGNSPERNGLTDASNDLMAKLEYAKQRLAWLQGRQNLQHLQPTASRKIEFASVFELASKITLEKPSNDNTE